VKKISNNRDTYKVNDNISVAVVNKRNEDMESGSIHYERTVTIKIKAGKYAQEPLLFEQGSSIAEFIESINFEDPQQSLLDDLEPAPGGPVS
jgi:hypothetical protein